MPNADANIETTRPTRHHRLIEWLGLHQEKLWWLHSLYALLLGIGIMWLGQRNFSYLRLVVLHIGFIWASSFFLPMLLAHPGLSEIWKPRLRVFINFLNKNLYQQMLFFVLPIYYASATFGSRNIVFLFLVSLSAILSTLDIVYDRHLSVKRGLTAVFFAFNLFALINVMLPILWNVSNTVATRIGAVLALLGFLSLSYPRSQSKFRRLSIIVATGLLFFALVELGRPFIPPAPLRLASAGFGTALDKASLKIVAPLTELKPAGPLRLYALTSIKAPLGLSERVRHRWYENGKPVFASPFYSIVGGREEGFRLWTSFSMNGVAPQTTLRLDLETEGGQLIGRAGLETAH